ncbi:sensor histidine kinase [Cellulomonas endophytica]|uniref:sensor histidine kinase n=1 Tax=Cellulomonas endophytica TaxID=2494735 RepID=UPI00101349E8|nr:ATP-binding protein [Cellulomonas endophytica]
MGGATPDDDAGGRGADRRALLLGAGAVAGALGLAGAGHEVVLWAAAEHAGGAVLAGRGLAVRLAVDVVALAVLVGGLDALRVHARRGRVVPAVLALVAAAVSGLVRWGLLVLLDAPLGGAGGWGELAVGVVVALLAAVLGLEHTRRQRRLRERTRAAEREAVRVEDAVRALQAEEVRVRREVAEGLHSSLQQRIVLVVARLDRVLQAATARPLTRDELGSLRSARDDLELLRARDVRETSRLLYPEGLEIGLVPALRGLLRRVPTSIAVDLRVADEVRLLDDPSDPHLTPAERLLACRVVEEGVQNSLRHGAPRRLEVHVERDGTALVVTVGDDGRGFDAATVRRSGTARLAERLALVGGRLELTSVPGSGTRVRAHLPVDHLRRAPAAG